MSEVGRTSCKVCIMAYKGSGRDTPCDTCRPELKKVNIPYFTLYYYCQDQYIMGEGGPVGLNMLAINQAMQDYQIDEDEKVEFSLKVRQIAYVVISSRMEEAAQRAKQKR